MEARMSHTTGRISVCELKESIPKWACVCVRSVQRRGSRQLPSCAGIPSPRANRLGRTKCAVPAIVFAAQVQRNNLSLPLP